MLKVLLVKTSSLGDVVHNLPVVADIRARFPDACIDWLVEEAYAPLVRLQPAIRKAIPVAIRRWRSRPLGPSIWSELAVLRGLFCAERYDAIIDTQGLIKSALLARMARGRHHGFDAKSAREPLASLFYEVTHYVSRDQHAVQRNRSLAASALGYGVEGPVFWGIAAGEPLPARYAVLLHSTSRADKHWPEDRWVALAREMAATGLRCVLPWGSEEERSRSLRIASFIAGAEVPERLPLAQMAVMLGAASAVAGVEPWLTHVAAALGAPVAAIYCSTDPALTGVYGARRARNLGGPGIVPEVAQVSAALRELVAT